MKLTRREGLLWIVFGGGLVRSWANWPDAMPRPNQPPALLVGLRLTTGEEPNDPRYARQPLQYDADLWRTDVVKSTADITFPAATVDWGAPVDGFRLFVAHGNGTVHHLNDVPFPGPRRVYPGDVVLWPVEEGILRLAENGDREVA